MKLWLLKRTDADTMGWDEYVGFVIRAEDEAKARAIAAAKAADEGASTWLDASQSRCTRIGSCFDDDEGIVLDSFNAG